MTTSTTIDQSGVQSSERRSGVTLSRTVDWLVAIFLALAGLVFTVGGYFLYLAADRTRIAELVADGTIQSETLTDAELVGVVHGLVWYGGIGLAVMGLLLVLGGVAFLAFRTRSRRAREETAGPDATTNAIVGAVVTVVASFVPFSPVLGGAAAGYLQGGDTRTGVRVGAISGLIAASPLAVLFAFLVGGLAVVATELGLGFVAVVAGVALTFALAVAVFVLVGLGAAGGYVGSVLADRKRDREHEVAA